MFIPPDQTINAVAFYRNYARCASVGHLNGMCVIEKNANLRYTSGCLSEFSYTLTIPAENMTEFEQESVWRCEYYGDSAFRSPDVTLTIASKLHECMATPLSIIFFSL